MRSETSTAVLLIAHGSRRPEANAELETVAERLRAAGPQRPPVDYVACAYLELARPSIADGGRECVAAGARRVFLLPYFLSAGRHVVSDLEAHRAELQQEFPDVEFRLCPPLGLHPLMTDILLDRLAEGAAAAEPARNVK